MSHHTYRLVLLLLFLLVVINQAKHRHHRHHRHHHYYPRHYPLRLPRAYRASSSASANASAHCIHRLYNKGKLRHCEKRAQRRHHVTFALAHKFKYVNFTRGTNTSLDAEALHICNAYWSLLSCVNYHTCFKCTYKEAMALRGWQRRQLKWINRKKCRPAGKRYRMNWCQRKLKRRRKHWHKKDSDKSGSSHLGVICLIVATLVTVLAGISLAVYMLNQTVEKVKTASEMKGARLSKLKGGSTSASSKAPMEAAPAGSPKLKAASVKASSTGGGAPSAFSRPNKGKSAFSKSPVSQGQGKSTSASKKSRRIKGNGSKSQSKA